MFMVWYLVKHREFTLSSVPEIIEQWTKFHSQSCYRVAQNKKEN